MLNPQTSSLIRPHYLEDFKVGEKFVTPAVKVPPEQIVDFARQYDPQYYHLDPVAARNSVFGGLVAGGFQTAAFAWALGLRTGLFEHCAMAGLGIDKLQWLQPLRADDTIQCTMEVIENRPSQSKPDRGVVIFHYVMTNQNGEKIMTLNLIQILRSRPKGSSPT